MLRRLALRVRQLSSADLIGWLWIIALQGIALVIWIFLVCGLQQRWALWGIAALVIISQGLLLAMRHGFANGIDSCQKGEEVANSGGNVAACRNLVLQSHVVVKSFRKILHWLIYVDAADSRGTSGLELWPFGKRKFWNGVFRKRPMIKRQRQEYFSEQRPKNDSDISAHVGDSITRAYKSHTEGHPNTR